MVLDNAGSGNITTGAASAQILPARRGRRIAFSITNYGAQVAWVNPADYQVAAAGQGIPVYAGGTIADGNSEGYTCWQGSISCIQGAGGATTLAYWERVSA